MHKIPQLADLHYDINAAFANDEFNRLLNQPPHKSWIKKHSISKGEYLPIDKVEFLMTRIFQEWRVEVISYCALFQSVSVNIRLHYRNPVTGIWSYHDGVGACSVQTNAGEAASNMGAIKNAAVQMALPSAKSYAIKDAAEHLGTLFGRDLNRKDTIQFAGAYSKAVETLSLSQFNPAEL